MGSWKDSHPRQLKKIIFAMSLSGLEKLIESHEKRGWIISGEIKKHGYGLGCLMIWKNRRDESGTVDGDKKTSVEIYK
jgi:hypothetical protein